MSHPEGFNIGKKTPGKVLIIIGIIPFAFLFLLAIYFAVNGFADPFFGNKEGISAFVSIFLWGLIGGCYIYIPAGIAIGTGIKRISEEKKGKNEGQV